MKKVIVLSFLVIISLAQFQTPKFDQPSYVPANPPSNPEINQNTNQPQRQSPRVPQFPSSYKDLQNQLKGQGYPYDQIEQITQQEIYAIIAAYAFGLLCFLGISSALLCFCIKKRNQRQKIKRRMQELQVNFAQAHNMNVFEMQMQPRFPRTIHI